MNKVQLIPLLLICFFILSCSENSPTEPEPTFFEIQGENGFVGKVNGTNAFISILAGESKVVAYVCNGDERISEWFNEDIIDPKELNLKNRNGALISANYRENSFHGEMVLSNGNEYSFVATPSTEKSAGIYRIMGEEAETDGVKAGWILNSTGQVKGALIINSTFQQTLVFPQRNAVVKNTSYPVFRFLIKAPSPTSPVPLPYPNIPTDTSNTLISINYIWSRS